MTVPPQAGKGVEVAFTLNGRAVALVAPPVERASRTLRERAGAVDVKVGCDAGDCGACTILVDGAALCACMMPASRLAGRTVETLRGLAAGDPRHARLAAQFLARGAAQCGICTPGMLVSAVALLRANPAPDARAVEDGLGGVLCRCTGYRKIIEAVVAAGAGGEAPVATARGCVGAPIARLDGAAKVEGTDLFADDDAPAGALVLKAIRSPHDHARFAFGDLDAFLAERPGLEAVLTAADVPGVNAFGVIPGFEDQPVLADGVARFRGEAVAAVVGTAEAIAALDADEVPVAFEPLPAATDLRAATAADAPLVHAARPGNVMTGGFVARGDPDGALAGAAAVVEDTFETSFVEHAPIEPEAGHAVRIGDTVEIAATTQAPVMNRDSIAAILALPKESVRILPSAVGGGFGSKLDLSIQPLLALAAWRLGRPVRGAFTRAESMMATTKRHPARMRVRVGADADGTVVALDYAGDFNTGAYASWGPTVANRVPVHASGPYATPNYRARTRAIHTHRVPAGAFRGFGVPQSAVAQECLYDELADRLGIDRLDFRLRNALRDGVPTVTGQVFEAGVGIAACLEALRPRWRRAREEAAAFDPAGGPIRRGVGIAAGWYGCGNTSIANPSTIRCGVRRDGTVVLHQGAMDIGQGANTVITQIFAEALGVDPAAVARLGPDTAVTPDAGKTSASRQTFVSGNAARLAGEALRARILRHANASPDAALVFGAGRLGVREGGEAVREIDLAALAPDADGYVFHAVESWDPPTSPLDANGQGDPYATFGYAAHLVELAVDVELGTVRPLAIAAAHDVGRAINPVLVEGQVEGGIAQGLGMALMEDYVPGRTENLHDYLIPTIGDVPPVDTTIVEAADPHGPYGAKGLGEHALIPTAPAVLNAIRDATGARIRRLPATPDRVRAAILVARGGAA